MTREGRGPIKSKDSVSILLTSPLGLVCPYCKAARDQECTTKAGDVAGLHIDRVKAAAVIDKAKLTVS
jgi:hypothetical protein